MRLSSILETIGSLIRLADSTPKPSKKRQSNYPFLDPRNQGASYIRFSKGLPDHNSRVQALGQRASGMRRIKIVH